MRMALAAIRQPARHQEAAQPGVGLGEREEGIRHRRRAEPFVADQLEGALARRDGARGVGAHVRAALLLGHRHADQRAALGRDRRNRRIVLVRQDLGQPLARERRGIAQRRHGGKSHRDRAAHAALDLVQQEGGGGAGDMRARPRLGPGQVVHALGLRPFHQGVPGRVEREPRRSAGRSGRSSAARADGGWPARRARSRRACRARRRSCAAARGPRPRVRPPRRARGPARTGWCPRAAAAGC